MIVFVVLVVAVIRSRDFSLANIIVLLLLLSFWLFVQAGIKTRVKREENKTAQIMG